MKRTKSVRAGAGKTIGVPWTAACVAAFAARASLSFLSWLLRADSGMQWWLMAMICGDPDTRHVE